MKIGVVITMILILLGSVCIGVLHMANATQIPVELEMNEKKDEKENEKVLKISKLETTTEIHVFIAASLSSVMDEIATLYYEQQPNVTILFNADSSGTLMQQILEGASCDIFFSAATDKMETLEENELVVNGSRVDLLNNKVVLITPKDSGTQVTGFNDLYKAKNMALADGSVPVGNYARKILIHLGMIEHIEDAVDSDEVSAAEISKALGGIEINECSNVSKVKEAVKEGSNEIGIVYYSDAYSIQEDVDILAEAGSDLTGDIIYPVALINNLDAVEDTTLAAKEFLLFLQTKEVAQIFEKHKFFVPNSAEE